MKIQTAFHFQINMVTLCVWKWKCKLNYCLLILILTQIAHTHFENDNVVVKLRFNIHILILIWNLSHMSFHSHCWLGSECLSKDISNLKPTSPKCLLRYSSDVWQKKLIFMFYKVCACVWCGRQVTADLWRYRSLEVKVWTERMWTVVRLIILNRDGGRIYSCWPVQRPALSRLLPGVLSRKCPRRRGAVHGGQPKESCVKLATLTHGETDIRETFKINEQHI